MYVFIHLVSWLIIYLSIYLCIYLFIYLYIYLFSFYIFFIWRWYFNDDINVMSQCTSCETNVHHVAFAQEMYGLLT